MSSEVGVEVPKRRGRPAGLKTVPKHAPRAVSEIWRAATEEEREAARRSAEELLAYWRGLAGSKAVAGALGLRRNRVYLLQRKALAGMVTGLLAVRPKRDESGPRGSDPAKEAGDLRKEVSRLRKEREALVGLVRLLRALPSKEDRGCAKREGSSRGAGSGDGAGARGRRPGRAAGDGPGARGVGADATRVGKKD